jgi:hypothetical protein
MAEADSVGVDDEGIPKCSTIVITVRQESIDCTEYWKKYGKCKRLSENIKINRF